jgi:carboxyl-terminal processing protease
VQRQPGWFHLPSVLFGAFWAAVGILVTQSMVGPRLVELSRPPEEQMLAMVHRRLDQEYALAKDPQWLMRSGVEGMIEALDDPYSTFVGPEEMRRFREDASGTLVGIGVMMDGFGTVLYPQPGGAAEKAGLRPGDRFLTIDGVDVAEEALPGLSARLRGEPGSLLEVVVEHEDGTRMYTTLARGRVPTLTVGDVRMLDLERGIGHIHVRSFARTTGDEFDRALDRLDQQGMRGLILDLRWNIGGQLDAAIDLASNFLEGGVVCTLESRTAPPAARMADPTRTSHPGLPLVVLLNEWSASGSEVLAAALRERGAAVLVGQRSYGKGIYQDVFDFPQGQFAIKFTAGYYLTPRGRILEDHLHESFAGGLEPDVPVRAAPEEEAAIRAWQDRNPPPARYREDYERLFPQAASLAPPKDSSLEVATGLLRSALPPA